MSQIRLSLPPLKGISSFHKLLWRTHLWATVGTWDLEDDIVWRDVGVKLPMAISVCQSLEEAFVLQLNRELSVCMFYWFLFIVVNICIAYTAVLKFITLDFYAEILESSLGISLAILSESQMTKNVQKKFVCLFKLRFIARFARMCVCIYINVCVSVCMCTYIYIKVQMWANLLKDNCEKSQTVLYQGKTLTKMCQTQFPLPRRDFLAPVVADGCETRGGQDGSV